MDLPARRRVAVLARVVSAVALLATTRDALTASEAGLAAPASVQPLAIPFFIDRRLPHELKPALDEARRRLSDSRCAEIFTDFADPDGRRLDLNLAATGTSAPTYLALVLFYDGRPTEPCRSSHVLAWTNPGSRAVHVCWSQFSVQQRRSVGFAANTIIHEALHTLGLGETPPDPRVITEQVALRCGR